MGGWSTGIFGCFSDPGTCCLAIFGAPLLIGKTFLMVHKLWIFLNDAFKVKMRKRSEKMDHYGQFHQFHAA